MGTNISFLASVLLSLFLLHLSLRHVLVESAEREALEIIIGGGGGEDAPPPSPEYSYTPPPAYEECPPPPPPPCPPPPSPPPPPPPPEPIFPSLRVKMAYYVIQEFKKKIKDDPLCVRDTWKENSNPCNYRGFTCDDLPDFGKQKGLVGVDFNGFGFNGYNDKLPVAGFMEKLPDLIFFHANSNNFTGTVPKGLGPDKLRFLYELDLSNNKISGTFPEETLRPNLTFLDLRFNKLLGVVPPQVFFQEVDVLFLNNNGFSCQIPDTIGRTTAHYLTLANNQFFGNIPRTIGIGNTRENLYEILLLNNKLSGCLPVEIGNLKEMSLFDASRNQLTGPIPQSFACLRKMELLNFANNKLYGAVPELVCALPNLSNLSLANNYFTQVGPICRKLIEKKYLDVNKNCILDLPNQKTPKECDRFFSKVKPSPNEHYMLNYNPCKKGKYSSSEEKKPDQQREASAPFSYSPLKPHRL